MRKRIVIAFDQVRGFHVDLPSYRMIEGSWLPVTEPLIHADGVVPGAKVADVLALNPSVEVDLPDYTPVDQAGAIDAEALQAMYADHPVFGSADYVPPAIVEDKGA